MILQTGGRALGATSTRSRPASRALRRASDVLVEPTLLSFSSIRKMGEILICSLWRKFVEMAYVSKNQPRGRTPSTHRGLHLFTCYRPRGPIQYAKYMSVWQG